ncbi:glycoside hydrolase family 32 protein [Halpernia frigidisoli]|uniref:Fructan beta-fructosidase n=1 Tax=Halpernia frigidisoli TaxID=1125876 RepID=A0A1I3H1K5_9FLAO|nr:glycoside hydrolase family 32 protein [Halpernia frigidisoli]SFI29569.1 fructan beta-fructosidase [Halpernia frigidisoli]
MITKLINLKSVCFLLIFLLLNCKNQTDQSVIKVQSSVKTSTDSTITYKEPFRNQFHFSPEKHWMNDPNGMVFYKGIYHLFYQYYPDDIVWGPMHWGHATSKDLVHWENKKTALFPDKLGYIFSGSAVIDKENFSGLGTKENPPMVAIFTYHNMEFEKAKKINTQTQALAYSLDEGETWTKYKSNPIINNLDKKDFRDPKCFWNESTKEWNLVLVAGDRAQIYTSKNLLNWKLESEFGQNIGEHGGVWECPDLFKLKINNEEKWVLLISVNPGAPNGGSGTQYFVGDFDGKTFTTNQKDTKWLDYGADNYAGVTFSNLPEDERILVGWMSNWSYGQKTPTKNWRSSMTLPRQLSLNKINDQYILQSTPVNSFEKLLKKDYSKAVLDIKSNKKLQFDYPSLNESQINFQTKAENLKLVFYNDVKDSLVLNYIKNKNEFSVDRTHSGIINFGENFATKVHTTVLKNLISDQIKYQIILDRSSIEIFLNDGLYSFTEQIFPNKPYNHLKIISEEDLKLKDFKVSAVNSIWNKN